MKTIINIAIVLSVIFNVVFFIFVVYKLYLRNVDKNAPTTVGHPYWQDKVDYYEIINKTCPHQIYLVGDSMFDRLAIEKYFNDIEISNRGIGYDTTDSLLQRLERSVLSGHPRKILLYIGGNDLSHNNDAGGVIKNTEKIIKKIVDQNIDLAFVSLLPRGKNYKTDDRDVKNINEDIAYFNDIIQKKCSEDGCVYIDICDLFSTDDFYLDSRFTSDGVHLNAKGIIMMAKVLDPVLSEKTPPYKDF